MARNFSNGVTGGPTLGQFNLVENEISTAELNANLLLDPNGTGEVQIDSNIQVNQGNLLKFVDADSSHYVALDAPATITASHTLTLPTDSGTNGYFLQTDGSGNMSWQDVAVEVTQDTASGGTFFPYFGSTTTGQVTAVNVANSAKLSFVPSTGTLTCTAISATNGTFSGTMSAGTITETSSISLKENVSPIENALESLTKLVGVTYDRKDGSTKDEAGLIAEEVYKILPNIVSLDENEKPLGIMYTKLTAYLLEAVKDLKKQIDELKG